MKIDPKWQIKPFKALSAVELYDVLRLRNEVFVVEQNCVYQDIDGKDTKALHLLGTLDGKIVAYARLFDAQDYFSEPSIGRVAIDRAYRSNKWGHSLMREAIFGIELHFGKLPIVISAQQYLREFYQAHGFLQEGDVYDEDGIPHIKMIRKPTSL